jgi:hypothetical protein
VRVKAEQKGLAFSCEPEADLPRTIRATKAACDRCC